MNSIERIERRFKMSLPRLYTIWARQGFLFPKSSTDEQYLWVNEAEWIDPDEIPQWKLPTYGEHVPGLVPFAFSGAGDPWCWQTTLPTSTSEYEIWFCLHDEDSASVYAPTFAGWFVRNCLEYVASIEHQDAGYLVDVRDQLNNWSKRLALGDEREWAAYLLEIAAREPVWHHDRNDITGFRHFGLVSFDEIKSFTLSRFGERYVSEMEWQTSENHNRDASINGVREETAKLIAHNRRRVEFEVAFARAEEAFRARHFGDYVSLLSPFKDLLTPVQSKKLELAIRKAQG